MPTDFRRSSGYPVKRGQTTSLSAEIWVTMPRYRGRYSQLGQVVIIGLVIILLTPLLLMMVMMAMMVIMGGMGGNGTMTMSPIGSLIMMLGGFFVLLAVGYVLYRALRGAAKNTDPAMEELRIAYARGDMSKEEFEQRKKDLGESE